MEATLDPEDQASGGASCVDSGAKEERGEDDVAARSRSPPRVRAARVQEGEASLWQVVSLEEAKVMTRSDSSSIVLATKAPGTVIRGWEMGVAWVRLADEPGYILSTRDGLQLLKRTAVPVLGASAASGETAAAVEVEEEGKKEAELAEVQEPESEAPAPVFSCFACKAGFPDLESLAAHLLCSTACLGGPWQAAVNAMAALPGAGTKLWCPACPDDYAGRWSGSATKAAALLRHLGFAGRPPEPHAGAHARLLRALAALLLTNPPPHDADAATLQDWAGSSRLLAAAGPLLATPSAAARRAVLRLQTEALGEEASAAEATGSSKGDGNSKDGSTAAGKKKRKQESSSKKDVGGKLARVEGRSPLQEFYTDEIPLDVFSVCQDTTARTADGVPLMDLLSSDEEAKPATTARAAETAFAGPVVAASTAADEGVHWL